MASTIKLKNGSGAPTTGDLVQGEPALDLTNKRLYTENASGVVIEVGTNPSTIDINAGTIDGTVIGGSTAAAGTFTTGQFNTSLNVDGTTNLDVVDIDGAVDMASTLTVGGTTNDGTTLAQIVQSGTGRAFSVNRNVASATRAVVNLAQLQASGGAEAVLDIQQTTPASRAIKVTPDGSIDRFSVYGTGALVTTPVAGGHAVFNEGGADADFRVESATTANALFVEGSSGNVGIGTSSPDTLLHLSDTAGGAVIRLERNDTSIVSTDVYGEIQFEGQDSSAGSAAGIRGKILGVAEGVTGEMALAFQTAGSYGSSTERARLDSSGNLLVGKTALDNSTVGIRMNATGDASFVSDGARPLVLNRKTSDGDIALFLKDGTTVGSIGTIAGYMTAGTSDTGVLFHSGEDNIQPWNVSTNAGRDAAIDLGVAGARFKDLYLSGGVYLGGTGAANHLDDYEEGTWEPEIYYQNATDQGNATNTTQTGYYTKIGRVVTLDFRLIWNITGSPANDNIGVKNLPFTGGGDTFAAAGVAYPVNNSTTIPTLLLTRPVNGGTTALCQDGEMSSNLGNEFGSGNAKEIRGTVTYFTDA